MRIPASIILSAALVGCAGNPFSGHQLEPGTPRDVVLSRLGAPNRVIRTAEGERLQYTLQPFGQAAWMVDLDPAGRLLRSRQVLTANEFNRIEPGKWTRQDVEREFGRPAWVDTVASWNGPIMTYRWRQDGDMFYWVYLDANDVVRRAHPGMEFINAPDFRD